MATRWWLTNAAAPYTPTTRRGAWDVASGEDVQLLGRKPQGSAGTSSINAGSTAADRDVLLHRSISAGAIKAGTISGTASWTIGVRESNVDLNGVWHLHIYVTSGDSDTPRGTLLADYIGATEFTTTATGNAISGQAVTSVAVQVGDRIVVEIGYRAQSLSTTYNATINYGNTGGTDLSGGSTNVTTEPGWVELSGADGLFTPAFATLTDTFTSSIDAKWTKSASVTATGGRARIPCTTTLESLYTATAYEIQGSALAFQVPTVPVTGGGSGAFIAAYLGAGPTITNTNLEILYTPATANLQFRNNVGGSDGSPTNITYSATDHAWWRFREAAGSIYMETSPDNATWTTRRTISTPTQWMRLGTLIGYFEAQRTSGTGDFGELDSVNVSSTTTVAVTPAGETATALAPGRTKTRATSPGAQLDTAVVPGRTKSRAPAPAGQTDTAVAPGRSKTRASAFSTETDTAVPPGRTKNRTTSPAAEANTAVAPGRTKQRPTVSAAETETAVTPGRVKIRQITPAIEISTALVPAPAKTRALAPAIETDTARPPSRSQTLQITPAIETEAPAPPTALKTRTVVPANESEAAQGPGRTKARSAAPAVETDSAFAPAPAKTRAIAPATELDTAGQPGAAKALAIAPAAETDTAIAPATQPVRTPLFTTRPAPPRWSVRPAADRWTAHIP